MTLTLLCLFVGGLILGVPVAIWRIKSGMSMSVGQATVQGASWQK